MAFMSSKSFEEEQRRLQQKMTALGTEGMTLSMAKKKCSEAIELIAQDYPERLMYDIHTYHQTLKQIQDNELTINQGIQKIMLLNHKVQSEAGTLDYRYFMLVSQQLEKFISLIGDFIGSDLDNRILKAIEIHIDAFKVSDLTAAHGEISHENKILLKKLNEMNKKFQHFVQQASQN